MRIIYTLLLALMFGSSAIASEISEKKIREYLDQTLSYLATENYDQLIEMFHFPPSYSRDELSVDKCGVKGTLKDLFDFTGKPTSINNLRENSRFARFGVFGGSIPYWSNHPKSISIVKEANFEKTGIGVLSIELSFINSELELKSIKVGYYASEIDAKNKMISLTKSIRKQEQKRVTNGSCSVNEISS